MHVRALFSVNAYKNRINFLFFFFGIYIYINHSAAIMDAKSKS